MASVLVLSADLMFGSRLQAQLDAAGHDVQLIGDLERLRERLQDAVGVVLIVDLTDEGLDGAAALETLAADGALAGTPALAYYSHVDTQARERAERAGFDVAVPRSRIAREAARLVEQLL
jgi:CheY-like chemotaxis protein